MKGVFMKTILSILLGLLIIGLFSNNLLCLHLGSIIDIFL
jgi:hypothetical protein